MREKISWGFDSTYPKVLLQHFLSWNQKERNVLMRAFRGHQGQWRHLVKEASFEAEKKFKSKKK